MISPTSGAAVSLPETFYWQPRWSTSDSYEFDLFDYEDGDPYWISGHLGYVGSYKLDSLPTGFSPGVTYGWEVWVYGEQGFGVSYYYRYVKFNNSGLSQSPLTVTLPRPRVFDEISRLRPGE